MTHDIANAWDTTKSREFNRTAFPWQVACDGHEIPMRLGAGEWALYCFNFHTRTHGYYLFEKDIFVGDDYFAQFSEWSVLSNEERKKAILGRKNN